jgi:biotin carboxyl carrier protein
MKLRIQFEGRAYDVDVDFLDAGPKIIGNGHAAEAPVPASVLRRRLPQRLPEDTVCRSPLAGRVAAVVGAAGRRVRRNEPVLVIEAMKMEVPIGPAVDGTVKAIRVEPGDAVQTGQVLFEIA